MRFDNGPEFVAHAVSDWCRIQRRRFTFHRSRLAVAERLDRVVQWPPARRTAQLVALRLAAGSPRHHRRLALRLQRQPTHTAQDELSPTEFAPTVDYEPPTPSRIATGPPNGSPSSTRRRRVSAVAVPSAAACATFGPIKESGREATAAPASGTTPGPRLFKRSLPTSRLLHPVTRLHRPGLGEPSVAQAVARQS